MTRLAQELETYNRLKPQFLEEHEGEYVLLKTEQVIGFWKTKEEAMAAAHERFPLQSFMVRQVLREEPVYVIAPHPVVKCRP